MFQDHNFSDSILNTAMAILTESKNTGDTASILRECLAVFGKQSLDSFDSKEEKRVFWSMVEERKEAAKKKKGKPFVDASKDDDDDEDDDDDNCDVKESREENRQKQENELAASDAKNASEYAKGLDGGDNSSPDNRVRTMAAHRLASRLHKQLGNKDQSKYHDDQGVAHNKKAASAKHKDTRRSEFDDYDDDD